MSRLDVCPLPRLTTAARRSCELKSATAWGRKRKAEKRLRGVGPVHEERARCLRSHGSRSRRLKRAASASHAVLQFFCHCCKRQLQADCRLNSAAAWISRCAVAYCGRLASVGTSCSVRAFFVLQGDRPC